MTIKITQPVNNGDYIAIDETGKDWTNDVPLRIRKTAFANGWEVTQKTYPNGKPFFKFVKNGKPNILATGPARVSTPKSTKVNVAAPPVPTVVITDEMRSRFENHVEESMSINAMIEASVGLIPHYIKTDELRWKALVRNTLRTKNVLLVGPSGEGKTLHAKAIAEALGRPFERIDCGQTQDAEVALIGKTHYDPETGTFFNPSKLVKAIQTPNCVIALDEISRLTFEGQNLVFPLLDANTRELVLTSEIGTPTIKVAPGVSFICTANIGSQFHASNALDEALLNRLTMVEVKALTYDQRFKLFNEKFSIKKDVLQNVLQFVDDLDQEMLSNESPKIDKTLSTRQLEDILGYIEDGFSVYDTFQLTVFPTFSSDGGAESMRSYAVTVFQKYFGNISSTPTGTMNT